MTATIIATADAASTAVADFGSNPGALDMFEYVPAGLPGGRPLVVVMHGCTQTAAGMEPAGWNALADQYQFAVVYPQQRSANQQLGCFDWFLDGDISSGRGEAESIIEMVDTEIAKHGIDRTRVYVTGLSAGAAFTAVMLAAYPDRFRAGSIMSGVPYRCASDAASGSTCASSGSMKSAPQWGALVRAADPGFTGTYPRVQIWHGASDTTVVPANEAELIKQWTNAAGI
ncbi:MAG TPA: PHB depolymerase family esterase, partial [Kofleriaceae bacterium]|nr:PHB depolymerase family esterase [Kofleriaceae bacterium]